MEGTLPGAPTDEGADRVVCHVDMDCFYASCERLRDPSLRGEPVVVGMGYEDGETVGAVATASYEARAFGVESAQPISGALKRLPRRTAADPDDDDAPDPGETGHYRPVDMDLYESVAAAVKEVLHDCAETVREVSIDEAYLDASDRTAWDVIGGGDGAAERAGGERTLAEGFARHVKRRIEREAGVPASVGVAPNMTTAKVASDHDKPDGLTVVPPGTVESFLAPLPVDQIHGVGPVTARTLAEAGIETAGDLAAADPSELTDRFGSRGRDLYDRARGHDDRAVTPTGRPKSLSRESAFAGATDDRGRKEGVVRGLAADVAERARSRGALYRTIGIKAIEPPYEVNTRSESLPGPVEDADLVERVALDLLAEFDGRPVRKLGVRVSNLSFAAGEQSTLGGYDAETGASDRATGSADPAGASGAADARRGDGRDRRTGTDADPTLDDWVDESAAASDGTTRTASDGGSSRGRTDGQSSLGEFE
ncbi:DNA polymerase Y family protein [Candidatus Halobonum tyrrellensis]|uniref:DNA polymerase IV n=1 Tax=Candidatus Halobonum tyrrellensis G22 TaxID=1324957 RepID=V4GRP8_9EURY|nr:DNA polymerase IV [Candidatus Halobonum tyrrellensis]ESP87731.1 DNA polymerase IV [Candidatus Halobonum tyrrellensis G22]